MPSKSIVKLLGAEDERSRSCAVVLQTVIDSESKERPNRWFDQFRSLCEVAVVVAEGIGVDGERMMCDIADYVYGECRGRKNRRQLQLLASSTLRAGNRGYSSKIEKGERHRKRAREEPVTSESPVDSFVFRERLWELPSPMDHGVVLDRVGNEKEVTPNSNLQTPTLSEILVAAEAGSLSRCLELWRLRNVVDEKPRRESSSPSITPKIFPSAQSGRVETVPSTLLSRIAHAGVSKLES